jgi:hypothetical protein
MSPSFIIAIFPSRPPFCSSSHLFSSYSSPCRRPSSRVYSFWRSLLLLIQTSRQRLLPTRFVSGFRVSVRQGMCIIRTTATVAYLTCVKLILFYLTPSAFDGPNDSGLLHRATTGVQHTSRRFKPSLQSRCQPRHRRDSSSRSRRSLSPPSSRRRSILHNIYQLPLPRPPCCLQSFALIFSILTALVSTPHGCD